MARYSAAHYFLEGLVDLGVEYIFANLGTDHVSLIEEMARWDKQGRKHPEVILCPHEVVAVHMAGGYALATGRAQAVLVHVDAGTANACMAIQNLFRYRLPVMHTETNRVDKHAVEWLWKEWMNLLRLREDGVPIIGFTWFGLVDMKDWDTALTKIRGVVNRVGLYTLERKQRKVAREYRRLVQEYSQLPISSSKFPILTA